MKSDFLIAITQLAAEKNLPREVVFQVVEAALVSAYKRDSFDPNQTISVKIMPQTGEVLVYAHKTVVEEVADPRLEISLGEAEKLKADAQLGEVVLIETTPRDAGRIAAQTAKQVVLQRLREAEREAIYEEYSEKEGDILSGVVLRIEPKQIIIDLGKAEAVLPVSEQVRSEHYRNGQRLKVFLMEVARTSKGPQLVVSRTHKNLLRRLFELEVPEIYNGTVELKAIAREPGYRSKVAVAARQEGIDPVGSCVGMRGIRIQNIVNELHGERVDVVQWHPDVAAYVANALSPAQVLRVETDDREKTATVVVPDRQLSLAIGKEGQNARLAAKLTGWRIDIKSASVAEAERAEREAQRATDAEQGVVPEAAVVVPEPIAAVAPGVPEAPAAKLETEAPEQPSIAESVEGEALATVWRAAVPAAPAAVSQPAPPRVRFAEEVLQRAEPVPTKGRKKTKRELQEEEEARREARKRASKANQGRGWQSLLEDEDETEDETENETVDESDE